MEGMANFVTTLGGSDGDEEPIKAFGVAQKLQGSYIEPHP
jgi:hypothetical protein